MPCFWMTSEVSASGGRKIGDVMSRVVWGFVICSLLLMRLFFWGFFFLFLDFVFEGFGSLSARRANGFAASMSKSRKFSNSIKVTYLCRKIAIWTSVDLRGVTGTKGGFAISGF